MLAKKSSLENAKGGRQKGNCGGGGDGISGNKDDYEECKGGNGDSDEAAVDLFLVKIVEGYSNHDP